MLKIILLTIISKKLVIFILPSKFKSVLEQIISTLPLGLTPLSIKLLEINLFHQVFKLFLTKCLRLATLLVLFRRFSLNTVLNLMNKYNYQLIGSLNLKKLRNKSRFRNKLQVNAILLFLVRKNQHLIKMTFLEGKRKLF